jgi:hypothetical protein
VQGEAASVASALAEVRLSDATRAVEVGSKLERLARGAVTERQEILVSLWTVAVSEIAALFINVNLLDDPEARKAEFARGVDEIVDKHVAQEAIAR